MYLIDAASTIESLQEEVLQLRQLLGNGPPATAHTSGNNGRTNELEHNLALMTEELRSERAAAKQLSSKHRRQQRVLVEELERAVESERQWRMQCHRLTKELELLRNNNMTSPSSSISSRRDRPSSAGSRTSSRPRSRPNSRPSSRGSSPVSRSPKGSTTPTVGFGRFDPSAYVRAQEEKKAMSANRRRNSGSSTPPYPYRSNTPPPRATSSSNSRNGSRRNSNDGGRTSVGGIVPSGSSSRNRSPSNSRPSSAERVRQAARATASSTSSSGTMSPSSLARTQSNRVGGGGHTAARSRGGGNGSVNDSPRTLRPLSAEQKPNQSTSFAATQPISPSLDRKSSIAARSGRYGGTSDTASSASGVARKPKRTARIVEDGAKYGSISFHYRSYSHSH
jgi:hypothetical protein